MSAAAATRREACCAGSHTHTNPTTPTRLVAPTMLPAAAAARSRQHGATGLVRLFRQAIASSSAAAAPAGVTAAEPASRCSQTAQPAAAAFSPAPPLPPGTSSSSSTLALRARQPPQFSPLLVGQMSSAVRGAATVAAAGTGAEAAAAAASESDADSSVSSSSRQRRSRRSAIMPTSSSTPAAEEHASAAAPGAAASSSRPRSRSSRASKATATATPATPATPAKPRRSSRRATAGSSSAGGAAAAAAGGPAATEQDARQLLEQLQRYCVTYYAGDPVVPDDVYDSELLRFQSMLDGMRAAGHAALAQQLRDASPLQHVGAAPPVVSSLSKVSHPTPMTSLAAVKARAAVEAWGSRLGQKGILNPEAVDWVVEPKVDGLAVRILYRDGRLVLAATRGDGREGEDVTHNVSTRFAVQGLPVAVMQQGAAGAAGFTVPREFEVRGEVYITSADFEKLNARQAQAGQAAFANPRNAAAGSLRLLDPQEAAGRHLSFLAYQLVVPQDKAALMPPSQSGGLQLLEQLGFATTAAVTTKALQQQATFKGLHAAISAAELWMQQRDSVGFEVDGAVLKVDDLQLQAQLGVDGAKDPRWAVAWKFPSKQATTRVLDVEWSMGRTGVLTPVAKLEPVEVGGVTIQHVSLHNAGHLREMQLAPGDVVAVARAGDVIPQITGVVDRGVLQQRRPFREPAKCPSCSSPLAFVEAVSADAKGTLRCHNVVCPAQQLQKQVHFVDVCVKGIGQSTTRELWQRGWLNTPAGLYAVTKEDLLTLPLFGPRKADKALAAIQASRDVDLATLLCGLGIECIGRQQAANLAAQYKTMKRLQLAVSLTPAPLSDDDHSASSSSSRRSSSTTTDSSSTVERNPFFATLAGESLRAWFASSDNKLLLNQLRQAGVRCCQEDPAASSEVIPAAGSSSGSSVGGGLTPTPAAAEAAGAGGVSSSGGSSFPPVLEGLVICITGGIAAPEFENREAVAAFIVSLGGTFKNSLSRGTDWLVVGSKDSGKPPPKAKRAKAEAWGTRVMAEEEFFAEVAQRQQQQGQQQ